MKKRNLAIVLSTVSAAAVLAGAPALAQSVQTTGQWERPYGVATGQENQPWSSANSSASAGAISAARHRVMRQSVSAIHPPKILR